MTTVCFSNNYYRLFFSNVCSKYNNHTWKEECIIFITNIFLLLGLLTTFRGTTSKFYSKTEIMFLARD